MATDAAIMLLDCAKGVEPQTKKLFRVCKMRKMPIFTFVNKMDRPGRDPFDLIGEVEEVLGIGVYPITWPIQAGGRFLGVYHRVEKQVFLFTQVAARRRDRADGGAHARRPAPRGGPRRGGARAAPRATSSSSRPRATRSTRSSLARGEVTPMFFGSAITNFGLPQLLDSFIELIPPAAPRARATTAPSPPTTSGSPPSSSRSRRTWIAPTAIASPSSASAPAATTAG